MVNKNNDDCYATDDSPIENDNEISQAIENGTVDDKSEELAGWLMTKMFGEEVRKSLSLFVRWISVMINAIKDEFNSVLNRVDNVEERQSNVEDDFQDVIANATTDSEVILARKSDIYGEFNTLDPRIENIEKIISTWIPDGFEVKINHNLGANPKSILVEKYQNALDTEVNGFETSGQVFGSESTQVPTTIINNNFDNVTIKMPRIYELNGTLTQSIGSKNVWYLNEGINTIRFELNK
ncbi:hypothetical protein RD055328_08290 [Companilactobacillus sp. RD055328]|uniref:hypothetical protein n=1 Tax=Companilactobacillus sp. RD055328 TaxID=2916634 RepID=UPI001FC8DECF|nr:hypothetical protein [Companilactobacillus sp. RD055328]GKQ42906.1 hypothetical protein RD055328_08290 [Companilactobacillus sp. RD055328]